MIWDNPVLDRIIEQETFAEIICRLTPCEMAVALLRVDGLDDQEIGDALGITRAAVLERIKTATRRISRHVPGAAALLAGRDRFNSAHRYLTVPDDDDILSSGEVAGMLRCSGQTVRNWIAVGRFPNAQRDPAGQWQIPWRDLEDLIARSGFAS